MDMGALDSWYHTKRHFSIVPRHIHQTLDAVHSKQQDEKHIQYKDRILHVEHASFIHLAFKRVGEISKCP